jgi:glycosyltransferase involved in cell wall biosynthesis
MMVLGMTFTKGMKLSGWVDSGLFEREKLIYEEHLKQGHFDKIYWFTYGNRDAEIRNRLVKEGRLDRRIEVVPAPWYGGVFILRWLYSIRMQIVNKDICCKIDVIKTNQMGGAWAAALIAGKYKKPFILRTGYTYSSFITNRESKGIYNRIKSKIEYSFYKLVERKMYSLCDVAEVSSLHDKQYISDTYNISNTKITLLPNYIDCNKFYSDNDSKHERIADRILFVGRIDTQKNLRAIIESVKACNVGLDIYGAGPLKDELESYADMIGADVRFMGTRPNDELPQIYRSYRYYILASLYEGMPKTLLEAMACGCVCLGTKVEGIEEVISDHYNGFVASNITSEAIISKMKEMLSYIDYMEISKNASEHINKNFSLSGVAEREWENIQKCLY